MQPDKDKTFTLNTIIQKYSPECPDREKDQEMQKGLYPHFLFFFSSCEMF